MLASRPSLLVILSGGSSYRIGASGSLAFLPFFGGAVRWKTGQGQGSEMYSNFEYITNVMNNMFLDAC